MLKEKLIVLFGMVLGTAIVGSFFYLFYFIYPFPVPVVSETIDKFFFALEWNILPVAMLVFGFMIVAMQRFFSDAIDPISGIESESLMINCRYVDNTLQQAFVFLVVSLLLSLRLEGEMMKIIPLLSISFVLGRLLFWIGYHVNPLLRAPGMFINELVNYIPLGYIIYTLIEMHK